MIIDIACKTNVGLVRDHNEDSFVIGIDPAINNWNSIAEKYKVGDKGVFIVIADGMGGAEAGEIASKIAIQTAKKQFDKMTSTFPKTSFELLNLLKDIISKANKNIISDINDNPEREGMGTTILLSIIFNNHAYIAWVGDSRAYRHNLNGINSTRSFDLDNLEIITNDHSVVWEYVLSGNMSSEEARLHTHSNIITQSLGNLSKSVNPDVTILKLEKDDTLLFCTDGLNSMVSDKNIADILDKNKSAEKTCDKLIDKALKDGGYDNVTVCVLKINELDIDTIINERSASVTESTMLMKNNTKDRKDFFLKSGIYIAGLILLSLFGYAGMYFINNKLNSKSTVLVNSDIQKKKNNVKASISIDTSSEIIAVKKKITKGKKNVTYYSIKPNKPQVSKKTIVDSLEDITVSLKDSIIDIKKILKNINIEKLAKNEKDGYKIISKRISSLERYMLTYYNFNENSFSIRKSKIDSTNCINNSIERFKHIKILYNNFISRIAEKNIDSPKQGNQDSIKNDNVELKSDNRIMDTIEAIKINNPKIIKNNGKEKDTLYQN